MDLIRIDIGASDYVIDASLYDPGAVLSLNLIGSGKITVINGHVEIGELIGVSAFTSNTIIAKDNGSVTLNGGITSLNAINAFNFEVHGDSSIHYNASTINVGLIDNLANQLNVKYVGDNTAGSFTYTPPALSLLGGIGAANFNVTGMQDLDTFTVTGETLRETLGSPNLNLTTAPPGLLSPILVGLLRQTVTVTVPMTTQERLDYNYEKVAWLGGDTFTFPTGGFSNGIVTGTNFSDEMDIGYDDRDGSTPRDSIDGSDGDNDKIDARAGNDTVHGRAGDDIIWGRDGNDILFGGVGDDLLIGGDGSNTLYGDEGNDRLYTNETLISAGSSNKLYGGIGNDALYAGGYAAASLYGGADNDDLYGGSAAHLLEGGDGNDRLYAGTGYSSLYGGEGGDTLFGGTLSSTLFGDGGDDLIISGSSSVSGIASNLVGGTGNDTLIAGESRDRLYGGVGNDVLIGGGRTLYLEGGDGNDHIILGAPGLSLAEASIASIFGGAGFDMVDYSQSGASVVVNLNDGITNTGFTYNSLNSFGNYNRLVDIEGLTGSSFNDTLGGNSAANLLVGGGGNDSISGGGGDDTISGGLGNDSLYGGTGNDTIYSGSGTDLLYGGDGRDHLYADGGNGTLYGGGGADMFHVVGASGVVVIADFEDGNLNDSDNSNNDVVDLSSFYNVATLAQWNLNNPTSQYGNPLAWMRADAADGVLNAVGAGLIILGTNGQPFDRNKLTYENTRVPCFTRGTLIDTPDGPKPVEDLAIGDLVLTLDQGAQPLSWIGCRKIDADELATCPNLRPIRFAAGSLGGGLPHRDLVVSPQHRMLLRSSVVENTTSAAEALLAAKHMLALEGVTVDETLQEVEYYHLMLEEHHILCAEGALSESFYFGTEAYDILGHDGFVHVTRTRPDLLLKPVTPARPLLRGKLGRKIIERISKNQKHVCDMTGEGAQKKQVA